VQEEDRIFNEDWRKIETPGQFFDEVLRPKHFTLVGEAYIDIARTYEQRSNRKYLTRPDLIVLH
jgi:hypothetical protein